MPTDPTIATIQTDLEGASEHTVHDVLINVCFYCRNEKKTDAHGDQTERRHGVIEEALDPDSH